MCGFDGCVVIGPFVSQTCCFYVKDGPEGWPTAPAFIGQLPVAHGRPPMVDCQPPSVECHSLSSRGR